MGWIRPYFKSRSYPARRPYCLNKLFFFLKIIIIANFVKTLHLLSGFRLTMIECKHLNEIEMVLKRKIENNKIVILCFLQLQITFFGCITLEQSTWQ